MSVHRLLLLASVARGFVALPRRLGPVARFGVGSLPDDFLNDIFDEADARGSAAEAYESQAYEASPRSGGGGGGGGWHDYERDPNDDGAAVDVARVDSLLAERVSAKKRRLFDEADAIRDELRDVHGVSVWDHETGDLREDRLL